MNKLIPVAVAAGLVLASIVAVSFPINAVENGMAKGVNPDASAIGGGGARTLRVGDDVGIGETVETGPTGQVQLIFDDQTELVIGPKSKLRIDDYLIRNDGSAGNIAIAALAGTFRFATGSSDHDNYKISTPTGTIGVRGTWFDFNVLQQQLADFLGDVDWVTTVLLYNGAVELCSLNGNCAIIDTVCGFGAESVTEAILLDNNRQVRDLLRANFIYANDQTPLLPRFRFPDARNCIAPPPDQAGGPPTLSGTQGGPAVTTTTTIPTTTTTPTTTTVPTTTYTVPTSSTAPTTTIDNN